MLELAPNYYKKFRCLGTECPDTCCQGWRIALDKKTHDKYTNSKVKTIRQKSEKYIKKINNPSEVFFSYISMDENNFCPFLNKQNLCGLQTKYGEDILSGTCDTFPRIKANYPNDVKLCSLDLSCPEAVKLCLTERDSMHFSLGDKKTEDSYIKFFSKNDSHALLIGEKIFNFSFSLIKDEKLELSKSMLIINKILDEKNKLYENIHTIDNSLNNFKTVFTKESFLDFDTSFIKLEFLDKLNSYIQEVIGDLKQFKYIGSKLSETHYQLIKKFSNIDLASENLKRTEENFAEKFDIHNNFMFRNYYLNELISNAVMFTNPNNYRENSLLISQFKEVLLKFFILGYISKNDIDDSLVDRIIDFLYHINRSYGIYCSFSNNMQKKLSNDMINLLKKIDKNSPSNSLFFLTN